LTKHLTLHHSIFEQDPYDTSYALLLHMSVMVEVGLKNELFYYAHRLVEREPQSAHSWYAVGCYYMLVNEFENARRYFR